MSSRVLRNSVSLLAVAAAVLAGGIALAQTPTPPAPPTNVAASISMPIGAKVGNLNVRWAASAGATSYNVYLAMGYSQPLQFKKLSTANLFWQGTASSGVLYTIYVTAVGPGGESQKSATVTAQHRSVASGG